MPQPSDWPATRPPASAGGSLFDAPSNVSPAPFEGQRHAGQQIKRFRGQCLLIIELLREGPVSNRRLAELGILKYTSRFSELRQAGYQIECEEREGGLSIYRMVGEPPCPEK